MTYADIITIAILSGILAFIVLLLIDVWLTNRRFKRELEQVENFRQLYDQAIADSFRPKQ